jgi:hypothetical protein
MKVQSIKLLAVFAFLSCIAMMVCDAVVIKLFSCTYLASKSDIVIVGRVKTLVSMKVNRGSSINTYATLKIIELYKGHTFDSCIVVELLGGEIENEKMIVPGEASLEKNEEVVLFLRKTNKANTYFRVFALAQGKYKIIARDIEGDHLISRSLTGVVYSSIGKYENPSRLSSLKTIVLNADSLSKGEGK